MTKHIHEFAEAAEDFCDWAEGSACSPENEALAALQHLSRLYRHALTLPARFGEEEAGEVSHDAWVQIYARFGTLPFNYYSQCFNPSDPSAEAPGVADLADDLADVWRDLKRGLSLFNAGHVDAACWEWRQGFWQHWGHHAAGGIYALHTWLAERSQGDG